MAVFLVSKRLPVAVVVAGFALCSRDWVGRCTCVCRRLGRHQVTLTVELLPQNRPKWPLLPEYLDSERTPQLGSPAPKHLQFGAHPLSEPGLLLLAVASTPGSLLTAGCHLLGSQPRLGAGTGGCSGHSQPIWVCFGAAASRNPYIAVHFSR